MSLKLGSNFIINLCHSLGYNRDDWNSEEDW